jgi:glutathione S-transferase
MGCAEWKEQRNLSSFAGPFGQLPVLEWEDTERDELITVVQTVAIAQYLAFQVPALPSGATYTQEALWGLSRVDDQDNTTLRVMLLRPRHVCDRHSPRLTLT